MRQDLEQREAAMQKKRTMNSSLEGQLAQLLREASQSSNANTLSSLQQQIKDTSKQHAEEMKLLQDRLHLAEKERNELKEQLKQMEIEKMRLEKKLSSDTIQATKNILSMS